MDQQRQFEVGGRRYVLVWPGPEGQAAYGQVVRGLRGSDLVEAEGRAFNRFRGVLVARCLLQAETGKPVFREVGDDAVDEAVLRRGAEELCRWTEPLVANARQGS